MAGEAGRPVGGNCRKKTWRVSLRVLLLVWSLLFLSMGILADSTRAVRRVPAPPFGGRLKPAELVESSGVSGLNYVSKRRVPDGPDPIHNRHVGPSRRPSGRA